MSPWRNSYGADDLKQQQLRSRRELASAIAKAIGEATVPIQRGPESTVTPRTCRHLYSVQIPRTFEQRLYRSTPAQRRGTPYGWIDVAFRHCPLCRADLTVPPPRQNAWLNKKKEALEKTRIGRAVVKNFPQRSTVEEIQLPELLVWSKPKKPRKKARENG